MQPLMISSPSFTSRGRLSPVSALVFSDGRLIADRSAASVLCDPELVERAALKETSLFTLAGRAGITPPEKFVDRFIAYDREVRSHGSHHSA